MKSFLKDLFKACVNTENQICFCIQIRGSTTPSIIEFSSNYSQLFINIFSIDQLSLSGE